MCDWQAKDHEIFDTAPFLRSKPFVVNGYKVKGDVIENRFKVENA